MEPPWRRCLLRAPEKTSRRDSRLFSRLVADLLRSGVPVRFRAEGRSMSPSLQGGEFVTVEPVGEDSLSAGNIVLTDKSERLQAHRIVALPSGGPTLVTRGDAGWHPETIPLANVLGRVTQSERDGQIMNHHTRVACWRAAIRTFTKRAATAVAVRLRRSAPVAIFAIIACAYFAASASSVAAQTDLALTSAGSPSTVSPSGDITYTQAVTNNGPNAATTAVLYEQTPANTTFVSMTAPTGWTCATPAAGATGSVTCTDGANLNANTTATFTYIVAVNSGTAAGSTIYNWADVTSQTADTLPSNNSITNSTLVETAGDSDLGVTVSASPTPVFVTSPLTYTIVVTNYGPAATMRHPHRRSSDRLHLRFRCHQSVVGHLHRHCDSHLRAWRHRGRRYRHD